jgi:hypothetical protein
VRPHDSYPVNGYVSTTASTRLAQTVSPESPVKRSRPREALVLLGYSPARQLKAYLG